MVSCSRKQNGKKHFANQSRSNNKITHSAVIKKIREEQNWRYPQPKKASPQQFYFKFFQNYKVTSRDQLIALPFLFLLGGAYYVSVRHQYQKPSSTQSVCTNKEISAYNKPNIVLGAHERTIMPKSCIPAISSSTCANEQKIFTDFYTRGTHPYTFSNGEKYVDRRDQVASNFAVWENAVDPAIENIESELSDANLTVFSSVIQKLKYLQFSIFSSEDTFQHKHGNCGDQTSMAFTQLTSLKDANELPKKIQKVNLVSSESSNYVKDHTFLLLDSDTADLTIRYDARRVANMLETIDTGKICDPWNSGYFADIKTDDSGFYHGPAHWNSIEIQTISLDSQEINQLPDNAKQFILKQLMQAKLFGQLLFENRIDDCREEEQLEAASVKPV